MKYQLKYRSCWSGDIYNPLVKVELKERVGYRGSQKSVYLFVDAFEEAVRKGIKSLNRLSNAYCDLDIEERAEFLGEDLDFNEVDLGGADIRMIDFRNVDFTGADLTDASFKNCSFYRCKFPAEGSTGIDFEGCYFDGTDFNGVNLVGTYFNRCDAATTKNDLLIVGTPNYYQMTAHRRDDTVWVRWGCRYMSLPAMEKRYRSGKQPKSQFHDEHYTREDRREGRAALAYIREIAKIRGWKVGDEAKRVRKPKA